MLKPAGSIAVTLIALLLLMVMGCANAYKALQPTQAERQCLQKFKPDFERALYNTKVNVYKRHLSGLLLIKLMPDSSTRLLFTNEAGFKFFDFEFSKDGAFKVYYILDKMDRKGLINTLRKDFALVMMNGLGAQPYEGFKADGLLYHRFFDGEEFNYYVTNATCDSLYRIEKKGKRKSKTFVIMQNYVEGIPDTIGITHKNFNLEIGLKRLDPLQRTGL